MRQRLAKLGYTSDLSKLSAWKADAFSLISVYIDDLQADELKKDKAKNSRRK